MEIKSKIRNYSVNFESIDKMDLREGDYLIIDSTFKSRQFGLKNKVSYIKAHETSKEYVKVAKIIDEIIKSGFRRNNRIIAIGGGVIQDISGFISSILYRGVDWVFYPTTLLAQGDSCIGGKTSINFGKYKNQIGNFYPPNKIIIDINFLETLPKLQIYSGLGEMAHYFFIDGRESFELFKTQINNPDYKLLIQKSLEIKKKMIELDEFDSGPRIIFNYGHSFGHALESITNYEVPHGIAVSIGMDISNHVSCLLGYITLDEKEEMSEILCKIYDVYYDKSLTENLDVYALMKILKTDKKNVGSNLGLILTRGLGDMFITQIESHDLIHKFVTSWKDGKKPNNWVFSPSPIFW